MESGTIYDDECGSGHGSQTLRVNLSNNWGVFSEPRARPLTEGQ